MQVSPFFVRFFPTFRGFFNRPFGERFFIGIWIVIAVALTIKAMVKPGSHSVFPVYYQASWNWWLEESLYDRHPALDYFRYPPIAALFFFPFALFGPIMGTVLWGWVSVFVFALSCHRLHSSFFAKDGRQFGLIVFGLVSLTGALAGIWNFQSNAFIGALLILGLLNANDCRWNRASLFFTLAILLKPTVFPPICLLGVYHPWKLGWRVSLALLAGFLFPFLTKPPYIVLWQYQEWLEHIRDTQGERWPGFRDAWFAWLALREQWQGDALWPTFWDVVPNLVYRVSQVTSGLVCLAAVILWRYRGLGRTQFLIRSMTLGLTWLMLFGPATEFPTFGLISPLLAWGALASWKKPNGFLVSIGLILILVLGWRPVVVGIAPSFPLVLLAIPMGVLLFGFWLFADTAQRIEDLSITGKPFDGNHFLENKDLEMQGLAA